MKYSVFLPINRDRNSGLLVFKLRKYSKSPDITLTVNINLIIRLAKDDDDP